MKILKNIALLGLGLGLGVVGFAHYLDMNERLIDRLRKLAEDVVCDEYEE